MWLWHIICKSLLIKYWTITTVICDFVVGRNTFTAPVAWYLFSKDGGDDQICVIAALAEKIKTAKILQLGRSKDKWCCQWILTGVWEKSVPFCLLVWDIYHVKVDTVITSWNNLRQKWGWQNANTMKAKSPNEMKSNTRASHCGGHQKDKWLCKTAQAKLTSVSILQTWDCKLTKYGL